MATKGQIFRLAARIEGLAQQSDRRLAVAYVWRNRGETEEQALERHFADRPEDRAAKSTYVFGWLDPKGSESRGDPLTP
jgi:hypothetical protein